MTSATCHTSVLHGMAIFGHMLMNRLPSVLVSVEALCCVRCVFFVYMLFCQEALLQVEEEISYFGYYGYSFISCFMCCLVAKLSFFIVLHNHPSYILIILVNLEKC